MACVLYRWIAALIMTAACAALPPNAHATDERVALVIGNSAYQHTPALENPRNDAADVAEALERLDFTVVEGRDLDKAAMDRTIHRFARELRDAEVGLFFYAGHGLQVRGQNYMVPVDARLESAAALDFEMVRLDLVHRTMERSTRTNLIFLDACRDNPLSRNLARALGTRSASIGRGLAAVKSGVGTLISFSTQPGNVAVDGTGRNSPFAAALVKHIGKPSEDLSSILIDVRNDVMAATGRRQVPWEHSALTAKFYFSPPPTEPGGAAEDLKTSALPKLESPRKQGPFDGNWKLSRASPGCRRAKREAEVRVANGTISLRWGSGKISANGKIHISEKYGSRTGEYRGTIVGDGGSGSFVGRSQRGTCHGTFTLIRMP